MEEKHIVVKCCRCRRIRMEDRWMREEEGGREAFLFSHSYCPACAEKIHAELEDLPVAAAC